METNTSAVDIATNNDPTSQTDPTATSQQPILRLEDVTYAYTSKKTILKDLSYSFDKGKVYAVVGRSGSGKTTLLSLLAGLTKPQSGKIWFNGNDLAKQNSYLYRSHDIGVVFQSFNLLPSLTAEENIMLSMDASGKKFPKKKKQLAEELIEKVGLPRDYAETRVLKLSGGEQQRIAIARALSYDPSILLADEPTGNLDAQTEHDIMDILSSLAHDENRCVIIVTHSQAVAGRADVVYQLQR